MSMSCRRDTKFELKGAEESRTWDGISLCLLLDHILPHSWCTLKDSLLSKFSLAQSCRSFSPLSLQ